MLLARAVVAAAADRRGPPRVARRPADRSSALDTIAFAYDDDVRSAAARRRRLHSNPGSRDERSLAQAESDAADDAERARARAAESAEDLARARSAMKARATPPRRGLPETSPLQLATAAYVELFRYLVNTGRATPDSKLRDVLHCRFFVSDPAVKRARHRCHASLVLLDREGAACGDDDDEDDDEFLLRCAAEEPGDEAHSCLGRWAFTKAEAQEDAFRELLTKLREEDARTAASDRRRRVPRRR